MSVVVPLHNAAEYVGDAVRSILAQSVPNWEAIIVDDGSTDESAGVAARAAGGDPRVSIISHPNAGLAHARNTGIDCATGDFVHLLDADDWLFPGALECLLAGANETGAAYGGSAWFDAEGRSLDWSWSSSCPLVGFDELLEFNRFTPGAQIIRRDLLGTERFDPAITGAEDHDLWLRLAFRGVRWRAVDGDVVAYRLRPGAMSRDHARMARGRRLALQRAFDRLDSQEAATERVFMLNGGSTPPTTISPARRDRLFLASVLAEATAGAWNDRSPGFERSLAILHESPSNARITPEAAARAAAWSLPYAACLPPTAWNNDDALFERLCAVSAAFWRALEKSMVDANATEAATERVIPGGGRSGGCSPFVESARRELAAMILPPERIADAIVNALPPDSETVLLGLGRNAAALTAALARAGRRFAGFDDALGDRAGALRLGGANVPILSAKEAFRGGQTLILTPERDDALASRIPPGTRAVRWRDIAGTLAEEQESRLARAWPATKPIPMEHAA